MLSILIMVMVILLPFTQAVNPPAKAKRWKESTQAPAQTIKRQYIDYGRLYDKLEATQNMIQALDCTIDSLRTERDDLEKQLCHAMQTNNERRKSVLYHRLDAINEKIARKALQAANMESNAAKIEKQLSA